MINTEAASSPRLNHWISLHPAASYFLLTFTISWTSALIVIAPRLLRGEAVPKFTGLMIFPIMLLGPLLASLALTRLTNPQRGLRTLVSRMLIFRVNPRWYAVLLIPPLLILTILHLLQAFVSPTFAPNFFLIGLCFGIVAGFVEEVGWTGFAFPALTAHRKPFAAALLLGLLWSLWHIPVVDYLGTATPHGPYWLPYFLTFAAAITAIRVLISWLYTNTGSVSLAQLLHASSTGSLVVLSPSRATAAQEALWYGLYALALWIVVALVVRTCGSSLRSPTQTQ